MNISDWVGTLGAGVAAIGALVGALFERSAASQRNKDAVSGNESGESKPVRRLTSASAALTAVVTAVSVILVLAALLGGYISH